MSYSIALFKSAMGSRIARGPYGPMIRWWHFARQFFAFRNLWVRVRGYVSRQDGGCRPRLLTAQPRLLGGCYRAVPRTISVSAGVQSGEEPHNTALGGYVGRSGGGTSTLNFVSGCPGSVHDLLRLVSRFGVLTDGRPRDRVSQRSSDPACLASSPLATALRAMCHGWIVAYRSQGAIPSGTWNSGDPGIGAHCESRLPVSNRRPGTLIRHG